MKLTEIEHMLPGVFQQAIVEGSPLFALLQVIEALPARDEAILEQLDAFFDPYRAPETFLPFLASWVDQDHLLQRNHKILNTSFSATFPGGMGRLRELIAAATFLAQWRGTAKGLRRFLEIATGTQGFVIEEQVIGTDGLPRPFHLRIHAPRAAARYRVMVEQIIELEKPAYVTYELVFTEDAPDIPPHK